MKKPGGRSNVSPRTFSPREEFLRKQLQAKRRRTWKAGLEESCRRQFPYGRGILYWGKGVHSLVTPLAVAKVLADQLRVNPSVGGQLLMKVVQGRRKGFVPGMMKLLGEYLENPLPVFAYVDHKIVDILMRHPSSTISEITSELYPQFYEQYSEKKWKALTRRVQRFVENVPWLPKEQASPDCWSDTY